MKNLIIIITILLSLISYSQKIYISNTKVAMCKYDTLTGQLHDEDYSIMEIVPTMFKIYDDKIIIEIEGSTLSYSIIGTKENKNFIAYRTLLNNNLVLFSYYKDPKLKKEEYNISINMVVDGLFMQFFVK